MIVLTSVAAPEEGVKLTQEQVQAYVGNQCLGNGTLIVSEGSVTWIASNAASNVGASAGFALTYPSIVLHAISTDLTNFAEEHIYVLVDGNKSERRRRRVPVLFTQEEAARQQDLQLANEELDGEEDDAEDDDSEAGRSIEIRFVPDDKQSMAQIYHEICVCQELNPDENDSFSEDDEMEEGADGDYEMVQDGAGQVGEEGRWFTAENMEDVELSEEGLANLQRMMGGGGQHNGTNGTH